jgi:glycosyltransferase involved in cell wall biosynthesis
MPVYNGAAHIEEALESLLAQSHPDLAVAVVDDGSSDDSLEVAERFASVDPRVTVRRNPERLGMVGNWVAVFGLARELHPEMEYFAWASDHDLWHPHWLAALMAEIEPRPEVVAAYPTTGRVSATGEQLKWTRKRLDTTGMAHARERLPEAVRKMMAGDQVYALFRVDALERAGVFRQVLLPDRLLLSELSLYGQFLQVPERLFFRRFLGETPTLGRQRSSLFSGNPPLRAYLPWWALHTLTLASALVVRGSGRPDIGRLRGAALTMRYAQLAAYWQARRHAIAAGRAVRSRSRRAAREANRKRKRTWRRFLRAGGRAKRRLLALAGALLRRVRGGPTGGTGT